MIYDFLIIGAGSAGIHTAHFLKKGGASVALVEQSDIGAGSSGAAGAFISPRIGKGGPIQRWTNKSFRFCIEHYKKSAYFIQSGLLRLPKSKESFEGLEQFLDVAFQKKEGGFFFPDAGILQAKPYLHSLIEKIPYFQFEAKLRRYGDIFAVGNLKTKRVILATGAWNALIQEPYIKIGKTSGVRFDVKTALTLPYCIHKKVSVSVNTGGIVSIGATHHRVDDSDSQPQSPAFLFEEAKSMVGDFDFEIAQMYCGIRSSVNDHLPIIGELIDSAKVGKITNFKKIDWQTLPRKGIYIINGLGGRGFVFGPYVAYLLSEHLINDAPIPDELHVDRYYLRYLKKGRV